MCAQCTLINMVSGTLMLDNCNVFLALSLLKVGYNTLFRTTFYFPTRDSKHQM